jgi:Ca2+-binding RTX toxin-like protein
MGVDTIDGGVGYDFWSADYSASTAALVANIGSTITLSNGSSATNIEGMNLTTGSGNDEFNVTRAIGNIEGGSGYDILNYAVTADAIHRNYKVVGYGTYLGGNISTYVTDGGYTAFSGIEKVVLKGGATGDTFQLSGNFLASAIDFDGGGQLPNSVNQLWGDFSSLTGNSTFVLNQDGTIASNRGTFANFYQAYLTGAGGNDVFTTQDGNDRLTGGGGDDVLSSGAGNDILNGDSGADSLYGGAGNDELNGGTGNDLLDGGTGDDVMTGGTGSDIYVVDSAGDVVNENPGEGTDEIRTSMTTFSLLGYTSIENLSAASDDAHDFRGNSGNNVITGGGGNDNLRLQDGGNDTVLGGGGNDNLFLIGSLTGADVVNGGDGTDTLVLQGNYAGGITLTANVTNIELISILAGSNTGFGESGAGRYDYVLTTHDANFSGAIQVRVNGSALLEGEDFTFDGSAELDSRFVVYGGRGKDSLTGSQNADIFFFAEERFATGDTVNGGAGYDGMFLRGNYTIDFNAPGYTGLFTNIENLTLTSASDERYARGGGTEFDYNLVLSNAIVKPGETLTVSGALLMANETMIVDAGAETDGVLSLFGGKASDTLKGGALADLIHGNLGADQLTGNGGADTFRYQGVGESTASSLDHILDFEAGVDKIDLSRMDADSNSAGNQAFSWIGSNAFSGSAGQLRAYQDGANWFVEGDTNGDGVADLVIQLTVTGGPLTQGDFLP